MWIEFDNLFSLENQVKNVAKQLVDITDTVEKQLRGGNLPYKREGHYITVEEKNFERYPEIKVIFDEYQELYDKVTKSLGIVHELPSQTVNLNDLTSDAQEVVLRRNKKTKE